MLVIQEREQEGHNHRLKAAFGEQIGCMPDLVEVERDVDQPGRRHDTLGYGDAVAALDQRL